MLSLVFEIPHFSRYLHYFRCFIFREVFQQNLSFAEFLLGTFEVDKLHREAGNHNSFAQLHNSPALPRFPFSIVMGHIKTCTQVYQCHLDSVVRQHASLRQL